MKYFLAYFFDCEGNPVKDTFDTELQAARYAARHGLELWKTKEKYIPMEAVK